MLKQFFQILILIGFITTANAKIHKIEIENKIPIDLNISMTFKYRYYRVGSSIAKKMVLTIPANSTIVEEYDDKGCPTQDIYFIDAEFRSNIMKEAIAGGVAMNINHLVKEISNYIYEKTIPKGKCTQTQKMFTGTYWPAHFRLDSGLNNHFIISQNNEDDPAEPENLVFVDIKY
ncbi:MAG: hypothetical protein HRT87_03200 [Legionellales bacterium]|nr:hypothetical protein [Legionellales bacterium]